MGYALTSGLAFGALFAYISGSSFVLQDVYGLSPQAFSLAFGVNGLGLVAGSQINARLVTRYGPAYLLRRALLVIAAAAAALLAVTIVDLGVWPVMISTFVVMSSLSFVMPNTTALALAEHGAVAGVGLRTARRHPVPRRRAGGAARRAGRNGQRRPDGRRHARARRRRGRSRSMALVAISAPYGAGGSRVAPALAEKLGVPFLDRPADTEPDHSLSKLCSIGLAWGTPAGMELEDLVPGDARRREIEAELEAMHDGVVLGRAAAVLLRDDPRVLRVLLTGPPERRIEQAMRWEGIDRHTAARRLERTDRARLAYHQTLYRVDPRSSELYHLMVDSTAIPLDACVELIAAAAHG